MTLTPINLRVMNKFEQENKYLRAKERVADIKKFYTSLMSYVVFIALLAGLNYYSNQGLFVLQEGIVLRIFNMTTIRVLFTHSPVSVRRTPKIYFIRNV